MCILPGPPSSPNAFPTGPPRAASALHFSKPQTRLRRSVPSDTAPSEGRGQMKGVSSTRSPLSHGPRPGHVPAAAAHARMSQPPTGPSENISWQPEAAGLAKPQLFTWSTGCRGHGDGERDRELFTSDSSDPRAGPLPAQHPSLDLPTTRDYPRWTKFFRERGGMFAPFWIDTRGGSVHPPPSTPQPRALLASPASWRAKAAGPAPSHRCLGCGSVLGLLTEPRRAGDGARHWLCPGARHPASPHLCLCSPLQRHLRNAQSLLS